MNLPGKEERPFVFDDSGRGVIQREYWIYPEEDPENPISQLALETPGKKIDPRYVAISYVSAFDITPLPGKGTIWYGELPWKIEASPELKGNEGLVVVTWEGVGAEMRENLLVVFLEPSPLLGPLYWGNVPKEDYLAAHGLPIEGAVPAGLWEDYSQVAKATLAGLQEMRVYPIWVDENGRFRPRSDQNPAKAGEIARAPVVYRLNREAERRR